MAAVVETVVVSSEKIDNALVALMTAEHYFEVMAGGETPPPWELFGDTLVELFRAAHGAEAMYGDVDGGSFSAHYTVLAERAQAEVRKFLHTQMAWVVD